jgi:hypothetical protein
VKKTFEIFTFSSMKEYLLPTEEGELQVLRQGGVVIKDDSPMEHELRALLDETRDFMDG